MTRRQNSTVTRKGVPHPPAPGRTTGTTKSQQRLDNEPRFTCPELFCSYHTDRQSDLTRHITTAHQDWSNGKPLYPCHGCRYIMCTKGKRKNHRCIQLWWKASVPLHLDLDTVAAGIQQVFQQRLNPHHQHGPAPAQLLQPAPPIPPRALNAQPTGLIPRQMPMITTFFNNFPATTPLSSAMPPATTPFQYLQSTAPPPQPMPPAIPPPPMAPHPAPPVNSVFPQIFDAFGAMAAASHQPTMQPAPNVLSSMPVPNFHLNNSTSQSGHVASADIDPALLDVGQNTQIGEDDPADILLSVVDSGVEGEDQMGGIDQDGFMTGGEDEEFGASSSTVYHEAQEQGQPSYQYPPPTDRGWTSPTEPYF